MLAGIRGANRTSKMEFFAKIVNSWKLLTLFAKKLHLRCSTINVSMLSTIAKINARNSHWRCSIKKGVLKNFTKSIGKHLCVRQFATLLKRGCATVRCFPVNLVKFLRKAFLQNTFGKLLLEYKDVFSTLQNINNGVFAKINNAF